MPTPPKMTTTFLSLACGLVMGFHMMNQPFYFKENNKGEAFILAMLFFVAVFNIAESIYAWFATVIAVCSLLPAIFIIFSAAAHFNHARKSMFIIVLFLFIIL